MKPFSESLRYEYPLTPESKVLDVGCFEGNWSHEIWKRYGCHVVAMEPILEFYWRCVRKLQPVGCTVLPYALGAKSRVETFKIHGDMSGIMADGESERVHVIGIEDLMRQLEWDHIDLLKLNCEGMEFEILEKVISWEFAPMVTNLQIQFHNNIPDAFMRRALIQEKLSDTHNCQFDEPFCWEGWKLK